MVNGMLHSKDCDRRRVTHCTEVLPTTSYSALDIRTVVKPSKEKLQKYPYFFIFPPISGCTLGMFQAHKRGTYYRITGANFML
ncbi:hypothetical protein TNCV_400511 [Trichonephila clavipes]|nr:hypothetical protein TNCV_400511 [Trichonephila clavipes]